MSDIPVSDKKQAEEGTEVADVKEATVAPVETEPTPEPKAPAEDSEEKGAPEKPATAQAGPQQVDINLGNVDVLMLRLLGEIRDEIRMLRVAVTAPRPMPSQPPQPQQ